MVFFTCSHCGESVKKPSVSKHYLTKCKNKDPFLTCVDCLKDFKGFEYEAHTVCMTEDERYSAKGYVPKPSQKKGERKQQAWQECIQTVLKKPTLKPDERDLIKAISKYENVPRKKSKFVNFLSNAFRHYANKSDLIDRVWTEMESVFKETSANSNEVQQQQIEEHQQELQDESKKVSVETKENGVKKEKKRKRKAEESKVSENSESDKANDKSKKKKAKHNEENGLESNTDPLPTNKMGDQEEKKSRKRRAVESSEVQQNNSIPVESDSGKKKKKRKHEKLTETQICKNSPQDSELASKSKKKKKSKSNNVEVKLDGVEMIIGSDNAKPAKKDKQSENKENCLEKATELSSNGGVDIEKTVSKKRKSAAAGDAEKLETFDWKATILQVLNQEGKNNKILLQKLQKKVLKLHCQILNCKNSEKKEKKFMKKLKDMPQIEIDEDFVLLKS